MKYYLAKENILNLKVSVLSQIVGMKPISKLSGRHLYLIVNEIKYIRARQQIMPKKIS